MTPCNSRPLPFNNKPHPLDTADSRIHIVVGVVKWKEVDKVTSLGELIDCDDVFRHSEWLAAYDVCHVT